MCEEAVEGATNPPKATQKRVHFVGLDDRQIEWSARRGQLHRKIRKDQHRRYKEWRKKQKQNSINSVSMSQSSMIDEKERTEKCVYFLCEAHKSILHLFGNATGEQETLLTLPIATVVRQYASTCMGLNEVVTEETPLDHLPRILLENLQYWNSRIGRNVDFWATESFEEKILIDKEKATIVKDSLKYIIDLLPSADRESASKIVGGLAKNKAKQPTVGSAKKAAIALKVGIENITADTNAHFAHRFISLHWLEKTDDMDQEEITSILGHVAPQLNGHFSSSDEDSDNDKGTN